MVHQSSGPWDFINLQGKNAKRKSCFRIKGHFWGGRKMAGESIAVCYLGTIKKYFLVLCGTSWVLRQLTTILMGSWQTIDRNQRKGTTIPSGILAFNFRPSKRNSRWNSWRVHIVKIEKFLCREDLGQWDRFEDLPWFGCVTTLNRYKLFKDRRSHFVSLIYVVQHFTHTRWAISRIRAVVLNEWIQLI